jgi:hypothetical protein
MTFNEVVVLIMFVPVYLQAHFNLSRMQAQFMFALLKRIVLFILGTKEDAKKEIQDQITSLPEDVRQLAYILEMDSEFQSYICCENCFALYDPKSYLPLSAPFDYSIRRPLPRAPQPPEGKEYGQLPEVPTMEWHIYQRTWNIPNGFLCSFTSTPDSDPCNHPLVKSITAQSKSGTAPVPRVSFTYRSIIHFLKDIASLPGITAHLTAKLREVDTMSIDSEAVTDIMESASIKQLKMPDGSPFAVQTPHELRLCLALFIDWFNAHGNTLRGGTHSTGGIYIVILNLSPDLRFQRKYLYHLFIPGPKEPSTEQLNNLLRPLINDLQVLYNNGFAMKNGQYQSFRAMLAVIVADQLAARKISGFSAVNHEWFCPFCRLPLRHHKTDFDVPNWPAMVSQADHLQIAKAWRDAPSKNARDAIFQRWGFRYTELIRLTYFNIMEQVVIEPFHAILTNVAQPHCREIIGEIHEIQDIEQFFDEEQSADSDSDVSIMIQDDEETDLVMQKGLAILRRQSLDEGALNQLFKLKVDILLRLCHRCKIPMWAIKHRGKSPTKQGMVVALGEWVSCSLSRVKSNVSIGCNDALS